MLERNFDVELPNTAWVTDVTYVWTHEGWLYLAAILDLFSRRVVGWAASANNDRALAVSALDRAVSASIMSITTTSETRGTAAAMVTRIVSRDLRLRPC